jgi:hypothetical protein
MDPTRSSKNSARDRHLVDNSPEEIARLDAGRDGKHANAQPRYQPGADRGGGALGLGVPQPGVAIAR